MQASAARRGPAGTGHRMATRAAWLEDRPRPCARAAARPGRRWSSPRFRPIGLDRPGERKTDQARRYARRPELIQADVPVVVHWAPAARWLAEPEGHALIFGRANRPFVAAPTEPVESRDHDQRRHDEQPKILAVEQRLDVRTAAPRSSAAHSDGRWTPPTAWWSTPIPHIQGTDLISTDVRRETPASDRGAAA